MKHSPRCLYSNRVSNFVAEDEDAIFGALSREYRNKRSMQILFMSASHIRQEASILLYCMDKSHLSAGLIR